MHCPVAFNSWSVRRHELLKRPIVNEFIGPDLLWPHDIFLGLAPASPFSLNQVFFG